MNMKKYRQVRAGTLGENCRAPTRYLKWCPKGGAWGTTLGVRTLAVCFGRVLEQHFFKINENDLWTPSLWSLSVQYPQSHGFNFPPVSFAPMLILSSHFQPTSQQYVFHCLSILWYSGNFKWVSFFEKWSLEKQVRQERIWGVHLSSKTDGLGLCIICVPGKNSILFCCVLKGLMY